MAIDMTNLSSLLSRADLLVQTPILGGGMLASGKRFAVRNPGTGTTIADVFDCVATEARAAIDFAATAFEDWRKVLPEERAAVLVRTAYGLRDHKEDLAKIITLEMGKPLSEALAEIEYSASYFDWFASEAVRNYGDVTLGSSMRMTVGLPVGVCAAITPWNFPSAMIARKVAPALAAGCTILVKPAEATPLSALALGKILLEAGCPEGVVQILPTSDPGSVAKPWLDSPIVRKLTFTGSTATGQKLMAACAPTLKRLSLELGGNAPFIVFEDADVEAAVEGALAAKFRNAGQTCVCANRFLVHETIAAAFAQKLSDRVACLRVGSGLNDSTQIGPLIDEKSAARVDALVRDAEALGATGLTKNSGTNGAYIQPVVMTGVSLDAACMQEEIFGPLAPIATFGDDEEAISIVNRSPYGLAAYAYTRDLKRAEYLVREVETGMLGLNTGQISSAAMPFGGVKQSGFGREGGATGMAEYLDQRAVVFE